MFHVHHTHHPLQPQHVIPGHHRLYFDQYGNNKYQLLL